jgi:hypothetical protein
VELHLSDLKKNSGDLKRMKVNHLLNTLLMWEKRMSRKKKDFINSFDKETNLLKTAIFLNAILSESHEALSWINHLTLLGVRETIRDIIEELHRKAKEEREKK